MSKSSSTGAGAAVAAVLAAPFLMMGLVLLHAAFMAFMYAFLGWMFPETMAAFQKVLGLSDIAPYQLGIICGWVSGVIKASFTVTK